jgi:hypothetical protein
MEFENKELDELLDSIGRWIIEDETRPSILNPLRMEQLSFSKAVLQKMVDGSNMKVSASVHEPFNSMGSICVEGEELEFGDCKWLGRVIEFASNVEIFPTFDGKVRLVLTFHGLTTPIETK